MGLSGDDLEIEIDSGVEEAKAKEYRPKCLADQLYDPLKYVAQRPKESAIVHFLVNFIFVSIGKTISGIVYYTTWPGFILLLMVLIYYLALKLARSIVYPMSNRTMLRSQEDSSAKYSQQVLAQSLRRELKHIKALSTVPEAAMRQRNSSNVAALELSIAKNVQSIQAGLKTNREEYISPMIMTLQVYCEQYGPSVEANGIGEKLAVDDNTMSQASELLKLLQVVLWLEDHINTQLKEALDRSPNNQGELSALITSLFHQSLDTQTPVGESQMLNPSTGLPEYPGSALVSSLKTAIVLCKCLAVAKQTKSDESKCPMGHTNSDDDDLRSKTGTARYLAMAKKYAGELASARKPYNGVASFDFLRAEMLAKLKAEQSWVTSADNHTRIDTMFIPCRGVDMNCPVHEDGRTVILCNPNAAVYEQLVMQPDTIRMYAKLGFNVLVFNYRGYGRSKGAPSPTGLCSDIEKIAEHLVANKGVRFGWLCVHGESIGGLVATHLARQAHRFGIFLLIADRTFSCLPETATALVGGWAGSALRKVLRWEADNVQDYIHAPDDVYKVTTCDPDDEIIAHSASLKLGIVGELLREARDMADPPILQGAEEEAWSGSLGAFLIGRNASWLLETNKVTKVLESFNAIVSGVEHCVNGEYQVPHHFISELRQALHMLWFVDGRCGQHLGLAYHATKSESPVKEQSDDDAATKKNSGPETYNPLHLWMASYVVWGPTTPRKNLPHSQLMEIMQRSAMLGVENRIRMWSLSGENGLYGDEHPIPMDTVVRVLGRFLSDQQHLLNQLGLLEPFSSLIESFQHLLAAFKKNQTLPSPIENRLGHLIPLTCGHNGVMSESEEESLQYHIKRATALHESKVAMHA